jgi:four helix bundle protein
MKISSFEEILAWKKALELTLLVYENFSELRDFSYRDQIKRASVSIMNNISEGFERQTDKEFKQFCYIAKGSSAEVRSMLILGLKLNYTKEEEFQKMYKLTLEIPKLLHGLIKSLDK